MPSFTVDTKLFRELGEHLVGRESTALVELIKNAYDADATRVDIFGQFLDNDEKGVLIVRDNGTGMSVQEFTDGFLRIAGRTKTGVDRRSRWFRRRFTGEKGIGRLAAHKLARAVEIETWRWDGKPWQEVIAFQSSEGVKASIDWDAIEELQSLADVESSNAVIVKKLEARTARQAGTQLLLNGLRRRWTEGDRRRFFNEVATLTPPTALIDSLPLEIVRSPLIFAVPKIRDGQNASEFSVNFEGELRLLESDLPATPQNASWIIEYDCDSTRRRLRISIQPTKKTIENFAVAEGFSIDRKLASDEPSVSFQARVFQQDNAAWPMAFRGVRVYYEGFRVLPYGDLRDDWLELDRDYRSRGRGELGRLRRFSQWDLPAGHEQESLIQQGNNAFFGGIFLTKEGASDLEMLINREGFLPSPSFNFITDMLRLGIDLQVRLRYAVTSEVKRARRDISEKHRRTAARTDDNQAPSAFLVTDLQKDALTSLRAARAAISGGQVKEATERLKAAERTILAASELTDEAASEATMYRVLASIGLEHAAFIHEVNSLALAAQAIAETINKLGRQTVSANIRKRFKQLEEQTTSLRERLRRNAVYLTDVTGIEGRRRRSRQRLKERFEVAAAFFESALAKRRIKLDNKIPHQVRTPPMFPAELTAIFSNLLSNAVKFAGQRGTIRVGASEDEETVTFRVENTGTVVQLGESKKWFEPFRSSTTDVDESLGQGMGLGLTITRSLLDEYGAEINFVQPSDGFATAIEVGLPKK